MRSTPAGPAVGNAHVSRRLWPLTGLTIGALAVAAALWPAAASACSVCLGDPDSQMAVGVNNGILVLLGCVALVQVGFFALFWSFRNRARRLERQRERFSLIEGGAK